MRAGQIFSDPHRDKSSSGEGRTPAAIAQALKIVLYVGAALAIWGFYRLSGGGEESPRSDASDVGMSKHASAGNYSNWEPAQ